MCVILDTYNNNTRIHTVKTRITHNGGSKVLSRRKQANKKNLWHRSSMKYEARHATHLFGKKDGHEQNLQTSNRSLYSRATTAIAID